MIQNKKYFALSSLALLAMIFVACSDDDPTEVYVGDMPQYQKAYITTGVSYPNAVALNGVYTSDALELNDEGTLVLVKGGQMEPVGGVSFDTDIFFRTTYPVKQAISGTVALAADAEEFVAQYNAEHETEYKLLPTEYYSLENAHATIAAGSKDAVINVVANTESPWDLGEYLLPLEMTLDAGASIALVEDKSKLTLKYEISAAPQSNIPEGAYLLTRDDFDIVLGTAPAGSYPENAFDANPNTFWQNDVSSNYTLTVTFKEPHCLSDVFVNNCDWYLYVYVAFEDAPENFTGGSMLPGEGKLFDLKPATRYGYDISKKVTSVKIRSYYSNIADIYFFVYD